MTLKNRLHLYEIKKFSWGVLANYTTFKIVVRGSTYIKIMTMMTTTDNSSLHGLTSTFVKWVKCSIVQHSFLNVPITVAITGGGEGAMPP